MLQTNEDFLNSVSFISENQAEYSILTDLYIRCPQKIFLLELVELSKIKELFSDVVQTINQRYKSYDLRLFVLENSGTVSDSIIESVAGSSLQDEQIINHAIDISQRNDSFVFARTRNALVLLHKGKFDHNFKNIFADKQMLIELEKDRKDIDQLEWVFEEFHLQRKYSKCEYIVSGKINNNVSEQQLRNHLISFLEQKTKLHIVTELCTSKTKDEESVDIGVIDSNNRVAIIEVKFFIKQGYFEDGKKKAYSPKRFKDGYMQLSRYCIHLNKDNYDLHSAFLYMFYAHSKTKNEILEDAKAYLDEYLGVSGGELCSEQFRNHYKGTICDDMLDLKSIV
ncbi:hypothetical protein SAMN02746066_04264 [Anaerosporobacter mobilis DSM 15930]|jgi:ribosomal protein S24E|uniref:Uncharacterized protein n=1 Tax=Anaerosporobacter mobilis DSM 15930 TaxID=1120996 RepID=A0A1M7N6J1_9FIRM|nr:hypothetical protein [Anaerosporobacter mobilis]SHM99180.1 hypothetical protein SAMN02746066_04264 [Anaerosporobacter mobilis DSM 15930]